jgi:hypothetical protein
MIKMFDEKELNFLIKFVQNEFNNCKTEKAKDLCVTIKIKLEAQLMKLHKQK